ncbi:hypothetical protein V8F33_001609 [Rhypophila sp. PSN 637]
MNPWFSFFVDLWIRCRRLYCYLFLFLVSPVIKRRILLLLGDWWHILGEFSQNRRYIQAFLFHYLPTYIYIPTLPAYLIRTRLLSHILVPDPFVSLSLHMSGRNLLLCLFVVVLVLGSMTYDWRCL